MESEINRAIREKFEELGIDTDKVYGEYTIVGHFSGLFYEKRREHYQMMASRINSHGFIGYLMGEYELKSKEDLK